MMMKVMAIKAGKIDWMVFSCADLRLIICLSVYSVSSLAFAHRLGIPATLNVTTKDVYTEALKQGVSFGELIAMPEKVRAVCKMCSDDHPGRVQGGTEAGCVIWRGDGDA